MNNKQWIFPGVIIGIVLLSLVLFPHRKQPAKTAAPQPMSAAPAQVAPYDENAMRAAQTVEEKIAAAAPLAIEAVKVCTRAAIPPSVITGIWGRETTYCKGEPMQPCPRSSSTPPSRGPTQHKPNAKGEYAFGLPGEDPERLADAFRMTARHLCDAKRADAGHAGEAIQDPGSDIAIMRYHGETSYANPSGYLKDVRANQAKHEAIFASLGAKGGPIIAGNEIPEGCVQIERGNYMCSPRPSGVEFFPGRMFTEPCTWFDSYGDRRDHRSVGRGYEPHTGFDFGCRATGIPVGSLCAGKVLTSIDLGGITGKMITVLCDGIQSKLDYMHMDSLAVRTGEHVSAGQLLGGCGASGTKHPDAPHVHLYVWKMTPSGWQRINPCAGQDGDTIVHCRDYYVAGVTRLNPIRDVYAAN